MHTRTADTPLVLMHSLSVALAESYSVAFAVSGGAGCCGGAGYVPLLGRCLPVFAAVIFASCDRGSVLVSDSVDVYICLFRLISARASLLRGYINYANTLAHSECRHVIRYMGQNAILLFFFHGTAEVLASPE